MNQLINHKAVVTTAPATPSLLKNEPDLGWWTPQVSQASLHWGQDIENSFNEPHTEP